MPVSPDRLAAAELRLAALRSQPEHWWEEAVPFFEVARARAWIVTRRIAHTAHHRGQQTALLRMLNRDLHSTYGPTADTGGLMQNHAPVIYAYAGLTALLRGDARARLQAAPHSVVGLGPGNPCDSQERQRSGKGCPGRGGAGRG